MNLDVAGIDYQPLVIGINNEFFQQRLPNPFISPTNKTAVSVAPPPITGGQISPRGTRPEDPKYPVDKLPIISGSASPNTLSPWQVGL